MKNQHYEVMVDNGNYPLSFQCNTIAEVYGCMESLMSWAPQIRFELDELMEMLVEMKRGHLLSHRAGGYMITIQEGEV